MAIPFVYVRARGSYREIGRQVGEAARPQIEASIAFFADNFVAMSGGLSFGAAERQAAAYLRYARAYTPEHVEELEGMAEGAGVPLSALLVPNCGEEFTASEPTVGAQPLPGERPARAGDARPGLHRGGDRLGGPPRRRSQHGLVRRRRGQQRALRPDRARRHPAAGLRRGGLPADRRPELARHRQPEQLGVLHRQPGRRAQRLRAARDHGGRDPRGGARAAACSPARARGTNQFFADTAGRLWDIESSATAERLRRSHARAATWRTPTTTSRPRWRRSRAPSDEESRTRLRTAEAMLVAGLDHGDEPVELVARILRCHEPSPQDCICGHPEPSEPIAEQGMTVGSIICDLDERRLYACAGTPCDNPYRGLRDGLMPRPTRAGRMPSATNARRGAAGRARRRRMVSWTTAGRRRRSRCPAATWCATWASCAA